MGDFLDGIGKAVSKIVHRIDDPIIASAVMGGTFDAVDDGITHSDIRRRHVYFCPDDMSAISKFTGSHTGK